MTDVRTLAAQIIAREGGYVDDPDDPGGATNFGVTIHTMRRLGLDLDRDGQITKADVRQLTRTQATEIFIRHYFVEPGISKLPEKLHATVFDMFVNSGGNAIKILQRLVTEFGLPLKADGAIGPKTVSAAGQAAELAPDHIVDAYGIARRNYYYRLADQRPASRKFARRRDGGKGGWILRAEAFISERFHFSDTQHKQRTASWG